MALGPAEHILEHAHNAFVAIDAEGRIVFWNASATATFGITRDQALARLVSETIIPERYRASHREGLAKFLATGEGPLLNERTEIAAIRADGSEFPVEITISALRGDDGAWSFHAFIQDISERATAQRERERLVGELQRSLSGSERRFDSVVGSLTDAVTIRDPSHRIVYANPVALAQLGFESLEALQNAALDGIMGDYIVRASDGSEVVMDDIPSVRILRGEAPEPLLIRTVRRETGAERWQLLKAAPLLDADGNVEAAITIIEDVTADKRSQLQLTFLAGASDLLASSLDYTQTLQNVAGLAVPDIADWCAVDLIEDGQRRPVAVAHVDPNRLRLAEQLRVYDPGEPDPEQGLGLVFATGESMLYPDIADEVLIEAAVDDEHLRLLRAVGMRSVLIVAMRVGSRVIGALTLVSAESGRIFDSQDRELAEQIATRAAVAVENARLYTERSRIARTLQKSLLPERLPHPPGWELASLYLPAGHGSEVGGDFYDVWSVGDHWLAMIGDVSGKGVGAAALTSLVRHTARTASEFESTPAKILELVDSTLKRQDSLSVCTALCLCVRNGTGTLAVGGHPLPLRLADGRVTQLGTHGPLLGAFAAAKWEQVEVEFALGDTIVAFTDGVTDAVGKRGRRFGDTALRTALREVSDEAAPAVVERLRRALTEFQVGEQADDTAVLVLRRLPKASSQRQRREAANG